MATTSTIAVQHADGTVSQIYCHFDGYLSGVGKTLLTHYNTLEQAEALVAMGGASCIRETLETSEFYHRNSQEELTVEKYSSWADYFLNAQTEGYDYVFTPDAGWLVMTYRTDRYLPLNEALEREVAEDAE